MGKKNRQHSEPAKAPEAKPEQETLEKVLELEEAPAEQAEVIEAPAEKAEAPKEPEAEEALKLDAALAPKREPKLRPGDELIKNSRGEVIGIKRAPNLNEQGRNGEAKKKELPKTKPNKRPKQHSEDGAHVNSRYLKFPTDQWGLTKDLKNALIQLGSRIAGDKRKMDLVNATLRIGIKHVMLKYERDSAVKAQRQAEADAAAE